MTLAAFASSPAPIFMLVTLTVLAYAVVLATLLRPRGERRPGRLIIAAFVQLVVGSALALAGALQPTTTKPPLLLLAVIPSTLIGAFVLPSIPAFRRAITALPPGALYLPHTFRILFGLAVLGLAVRGALPWQFAEPVGLGDIVVGLTAPLIYLAIRTGNPLGRPATLVWNVCGMLDFLQAGLIGFFAATGPQHRIDTAPPTDILTIFPVALIPTFALVTLYILHAWSVRSLLTRPSRAPAVRPLAARKVAV